MKNIIKFVFILSILLSNTFANGFIKTKIDNIITNKNIIVSIMNSNTGKIIYISDIKKATQYQFEPKSTMIPISIAIALKYKKLKINEQIHAKNGTITINGWNIKDRYKFSTNNISVENIIKYSSKVSISQIANRLSAKEFIYGIKSFGISEKTGIDINEKKGYIKSYRQYNTHKNNNIFLATSSYGIGIRVTHIQLLKAYNVFNNNGKIVRPYIKNNPRTNDRQIISKDIANTIKTYISKIDYKNQFTNTYFKFYNVNNKKYTIAITVNNEEVNKKELFRNITKAINDN